MLAWVSAVSGAVPWARLTAQPDEWFRSEDGRRVTANVLSHQSIRGSWPKNVETTAQPFTGDRAKVQGTFDNGATTGELRFLARAFAATREPALEAAFLKGFDHILEAQYPNGGWPQYFPPGNGYNRHITFNDDTMVRLLEFEREVTSAGLYQFVPAARRQAARESFDRGIQCILKCQIRVDGKLTAWCAQHDEIDLRPRPARTYELASLSGAESVRIVKFLMSLDQPSPPIMESVRAAVAWLDAAKLSGIRVTQVPDQNAPKGFDKRVVSDPSAPPIWARFYEIATNKPIFCDRDGVPKSSLAEIGYERRNGYAWLGYWANDVLVKEFPAWQKRWGKTGAGAP